MSTHHIGSVRAELTNMLVALARLVSDLDQIARAQAIEGMKADRGRTRRPYKKKPATPPSKPYSDPRGKSNKVPCEVCGRRFSLRGGMPSHMKVHREEHKL